jgi:hypothetical protein
MIGELFFGGANPNLIAMIHSDTVTLPVAPLHERVSAALRRLNTIKDLLIAAEGKVQVIDGQIQAMTGNHRHPYTHSNAPYGEHGGSLHAPTTLSTPVSFRP